VNIEQLKVYLVRNAEGQYYRRVGRSGGGPIWTDEWDVSKASVWTKIGAARSIVSYFLNKYPEYPPLSLIEVSAGEVIVLDEQQRLEKVKLKKANEAYKNINGI
jgi:hypothetical protein